MITLLWLARFWALYKLTLDLMCTLLVWVSNTNNIFTHAIYSINSQLWLRRQHSLKRQPLCQNNQHTRNYYIGGSIAGLLWVNFGLLGAFLCLLGKAEPKLSDSILYTVHLSDAAEESVARGPWRLVQYNSGKWQGGQYYHTAGRASGHGCLDSGIARGGPFGQGHL